MKRLLAIQGELKTPKSGYNDFGGYNYRTMSAINIAVKPLLIKHDVALVITDQLEQIGERYYIKATASLYDVTTGGIIASASAYARESLSKKGMDDSQITGTTSSYARKYAAMGLFLIDDSADADALNNHPEYNEPEPEPVLLPYPAESMATNMGAWQKAINEGKTTSEKLIAKISKNFLLSPQQAQTITNLGAAQ